MIHRGHQLFVVKALQQAQKRILDRAQLFVSTADIIKLASAKWYISGGLAAAVALYAAHSLSIPAPELSTKQIQTENIVSTNSASILTALDNEARNSTAKYWGDEDCSCSNTASKDH